MSHIKQGSANSAKEARSTNSKPSVIRIRNGRESMIISESNELNQYESDQKNKYNSSDPYEEGIRNLRYMKQMVKDKA